METHTDVALGFGSRALFYLPFLYLIVTAIVVVVITIAAWRIMKAQEATAAALQRIAAGFEKRPS